MKDSKIKKVKAREILNSKGNPTIEVEIETSLGKFLASVPSGTSKGKYEAKELKAKIAVKNVNEIINPQLKGKNPACQKEIDELLIKLDGTENKSKLGANAILGVSMAICRAGAKAEKLPLWKWISKVAKIKPRLAKPSILLIEGGLHGRGGSDIQEFMIVPQAKKFKESLIQAKRIYQELKKIIKKNYNLRTGIEGGFVLPIKNPKETLNLILTAVKQKKIKIILDIAASHYFRKKTPKYYLSLVKQYPILGLEDPFSQDDWSAWQKINSEFKTQKLKVLIIGDDLTVTNLKRIKRAHQRKACNAIILKLNQIGTVTEAIAAAKLAKSYGWKIMVSHRSGETLDDFIADLTVGIGAEFIKSGAPFPKERMVKYNRLLKIEQEIYG